MGLEQRPRFRYTRDGVDREMDMHWVEYRLGLPVRRYVWRGERRPRFAVEAIRRAEAEHGAPG